MDSRCVLFFSCHTQHHHCGKCRYSHSISPTPFSCARVRVCVHMVSGSVSSSCSMLIRLAFVPGLFILLRLPSATHTVLMAIFGDKYATGPFFEVIEALQAVGDTGQGLANGLLYVVCSDTVHRVFCLKGRGAGLRRRRRRRRRRGGGDGGGDGDGDGDGGNGSSPSSSRCCSFCSSCCCCCFFCDEDGDEYGQMVEERQLSETYSSTNADPYATGSARRGGRGGMWGGPSSSIAAGEYPEDDPSMSSYTAGAMPMPAPAPADSLLSSSLLSDPLHSSLLDDSPQLMPRGDNGAGGYGTASMVGASKA